MGTGITAILLHDLPYSAQWLHWISIAVFILNVVLFVVFLVVSLARYLIWPGTWTAMLYSSEQNLFLGAIPMSLGTIVSMICYVCVDAWGTSGQYLAIILWVIEVALSIACAFITPSLLINSNENIHLSTLTARHLFPAVSCVVASASGSVVASIITNPQHGLWIVLTSYVLWGIGLPMAMMILVVYCHRLLIHKLPPRELIVSVFIPIGKLCASLSMCVSTCSRSLSGPLGQGGFAIFSLGSLTTSIFPQTRTLHESTSGFLYDVGFFIALLCWAGGLLWTFFAIASICCSKRCFPFNVGWWVSIGS
jgi:tellurite resistance protein TehA-like permease